MINSLEPSLVLNFAHAVAFCARFGPERAARGRLNLLDPVEIEQIKGANLAITSPEGRGSADQPIRSPGRRLAAQQETSAPVDARHPRDLLAKCAARAPGRLGSAGFALAPRLLRVSFGPRNPTLRNGAGATQGRHRAAIVRFQSR